MLSALTIICAQTQVLQPQLVRMDGFADSDRGHLETGLAARITAARGLDASVRALSGMSKDSTGPLVVGG